ncbi:DUF3857 domain-containing protein [Reinekea sp. G2M2-21]|uniref:DUF3857 domain-containing protein n=1 Tax=Reinekea sp. G2M2-21 TaxID=2788942 RepID=UPI0018AC3B48|nr:DUF3857 domain-containing protein [Reinekea sp. G2M2-21]
MYFLLLLTGSLSYADNRLTTALSEQGFVQEAKSIIYALEGELSETSNVFRRMVIDINGDIVVKRVQEIWFYPDVVSVEDYGTDVIYMGQSDTSIVVNVAASVQSDGTVTMIDPQTIQFAEQDAYNTFNDTKVAYLPIPGLTKGSFTVTDYVVTENLRLNQGGYSDALWAEHYFPLLSIDLRVRWQNIDLVTDNSHPMLKCDQQVQEVHCVGSNIPALRATNNAFMRDKLRGLSVARKASWDDVIDSMLTLYQQAFEDADKVDRLYDQLSAGKNRQEDIIDAIFRFVSEDIRYVSLSTAGHTHQPHSNNSVIANRYGDCKDKTALLHALLVKAGLNPTPVLVTTYRADAGRLVLPSLGYFNHIVLCFDRNGQSFCLDPTDRNTHWTYTSDWIQGKVSLALNHGSIPSVITSATYRWQMNVDTQITLMPDGGSRESETRTYFGEYASLLRYQLENATGDKQLESLEKQFRDVVADVDNVDVKILTPIDGDRLTFKVSTEVSFQPYLDVEAPLNLTEYEYWFVDELSSLAIQTATEPVEVQGFLFNSRKSIDFSSHWRVTKTTPELLFEHRFGRIVRESDVQNGIMKVNTRIEMPHQTVAIEDIDEFNRFIDKVSDVLDVRLYGALR